MNYTKVNEELIILQKWWKHCNVTNLDLDNTTPINYGYDYNE